MLKERFTTAQPWLTLVVRLSTAVIMIWAGAAKLPDLPQSVRATRAYELLPEAIVPFVGKALPFAEVILGFVLLIGLWIRWSAWVYLAMMAAFVFGVAWAWANGLQIDCGCFGGGGALDAGETTDYPAHMWERAGFVALGVWLVVFPKSALSLDGLLAKLRPEPMLADD